MLRIFTRIYQFLIFAGGFLKSPLLLLCRLYWGWLFMMAGWGKLNDLSEFMATVHAQHVNVPTWLGYLVGLTEFFGGICLFVGFASRLAAIPLMIVMITAYFLVHQEGLHALFQHPSLFVAQPPFNYLLTTLLVLAFGPGRFSIDYMFEKWLFSRAQGIPKHQHFNQ